MTSFLTSLHLVKLKESDIEHTEDIDCVKLSTKCNCTHGQYSSAKREFLHRQYLKCEQEGKLKKNIKCVDKLLRKFKCLFLSWNLNEPLILFFSNGSIVNIEFNDKNNTLLKINIDNKLCGKFLPSRIVDIVMCKSYIYITYAEPKLGLICFNQDSPSLFGKIFGLKKVQFEPKVVNFDLYTQNTKSLERKLSLNIQRDLLLVWWSNSCDDVWPWSPITYLTDRVNMLLYSVNGICIEFLCSVKVQNELIHASFSKEITNQFFALEEIKKDGELFANVCVYEILDGNCQLISTTKLPLKRSLIAFSWSSTEDKLLAADSEGLLLIYDVKKNSTVITYLEFLPKHLSWHPQNCIALVVSRNNHILCFDAALNIINFKLYYKTSKELKYLELGLYFSHRFSIQKVLWQESIFNNTCLFLLDSGLSSFILIKFSFGCITRNNITVLEIISQYLKSDSFDKAILLLSSLNWCYKSDVKFQCLSKIVNCLLRKPLNFQTQGSIELALGTFYDLIEVLPKRIVERYEHRMHHLARRFFHRLLRYYKFRKAFLLAVDLESQDLFLDLYHVAKQKDQNILAAVALHKAEEFDESSESCSDSCSSHCHSELPYCNDIAYNSIISHNEPQSSIKINKYAPGFVVYNKKTATSNYSHETNSDADPSAFYHTHQLSNMSGKNVSNSKNGIFENYFKYIQQNSVILEENGSTNQARNSDRNYVIEERNDKIKNIRENSVVEEENEEVEGTQIKLAHLGVI